MPRRTQLMILTAACALSAAGQGYDIRVIAEADGGFGTTTWATFGGQNEMPALADDGTFVVVGFLTGLPGLRAAHFDGQSLNEIPLTPPTVGITSISISPDGQTIAYVKDDQPVFPVSERTARRLRNGIEETLGFADRYITVNNDGIVAALSGMGQITRFGTDGSPSFINTTDDGPISQVAAAIDIDHNGDLAFIATVPVNGPGEARVFQNQTAVITQDDFPGSDIGVSTSPSIRGGLVAAQLGLTTPDVGSRGVIASNSGPGPVIVVDPITPPFGGASMDRGPSINDHGEIAFRNSALTELPPGIQVLFPDGTMTTVLPANLAYTDASGENRTIGFASLGPRALNNAGQVVMLALTAGASGTRTAIVLATPVDDTCPADVNGDGVLNDSDFFAWVTAFTAAPRSPEQETACDVNRDGSCNDSDFFAWVTAFTGEGCP
ncbi:MAG: GC-type dockerin domain-anchored protein [Planctomycetota bacterium]